MNQDKQSEVIGMHHKQIATDARSESVRPSEGWLEDVARRNAGEPVLAVYHGDEWAILGESDLAYEEGVIASISVAAIRKALSRPSPSTPSEGVIEALVRARATILTQMRAAGGHSLPESYYAKHESIGLIDESLARLSPLPLVEEKQ
jgi:hypothetical protein